MAHAPASFLSVVLSLLQTRLIRNPRYLERYLTEVQSKPPGNKKAAPAGGLKGNTNQSLATTEQQSRSAQQSQHNRRGLWNQAETLEPISVLWRLRSASASRSTAKCNLSDSGSDSSTSNP